MLAAAHDHVNLVNVYSLHNVGDQYTVKYIVGFAYSFVVLCQAQAVM